MKKFLKIILISIGILFVGFIALGIIGSFLGYGQTDEEKFAEALRKGDEVAMEKYASRVNEKINEVAIDEYDNLDSVEIPDYFPRDFLYDPERGKVVEVVEGDNGAGTNWIMVTINTYDSPKIVQQYYEQKTTLLSSWKLDNTHESETGFSANYKTGYFMPEIELIVTKNKYQELTPILIQYFYKG